MSPAKWNIRTLVFSCLPLLFGASCATVQPPSELLAARAEYQQASESSTAKANPVGLHEAKKALDSANKSFDQDPGSLYTRDVSYIALRKVQLANAQAHIELANLEKTQAGVDKQKTTEVALAQSETRLSNSEEQRRQGNEQLNRSAEKLSRSDEALSRSDQALQTSGQQLDAEKQARHNAEQQAEEATASLAKIALVKQEQRGLVITLSGSILFTSGQSHLLVNARPKLDEVALALQKAEGNNFIVEGYTDSVGSESRNQDLSMRRANSVRDYLVDRGVSSERIKAVGYGRNKPIAENSTAEGRANNRRVEIVIQRREAS